jgi:hypothetical protein
VAIDVPTLDKYGDPGEGDDIRYTFDFSGWAFLAADPIVTASIPAVTGLTIGTPVVSDDGQWVDVLIEGGDPGVSYLVTCKVTTAAGRDIVGKVIIRVS